MNTLDTQELSIREAYRCTQRFLQNYWEEGGKSDDQIAIVLGGMALKPDGTSADPAMMSDWLDAVRAVTGKGPSPL